MTDTHTRQLAAVARIEQRRQRQLDQLDELEHSRHAAIVAAIDAGASLTAIAAAVGVSRQALTRYLERREQPHA